MLCDTLQLSAKSKVKKVSEVEVELFVDENRTL